MILGNSDGEVKEVAPIKDGVMIMMFKRTYVKIKKKVFRRLKKRLFGKLCQCND